MSYIFDINGKRHLISDVNAVETLMKLKEKSGSDPWPVIEKCIDIWRKKHPVEWKSYLVDVYDTRESRANKYASVHDRKNDGYLRYTLDIPERVMLMIRAIYNRDELPMDKEFFRAFARKFPGMRVAKAL